MADMIRYVADFYNNIRRNDIEMAKMASVSYQLISDSGNDPQEISRLKQENDLYRSIIVSLNSILDDHGVGDKEQSVEKRMTGALMASNERIKLLNKQIKQAGTRPARILDLDCDDRDDS